MIASKRIEKLASCLILVGIGLLFLASLTLICAAGTHLALLTGNKPYPVFRVPTDWFLSILGTKIPTPSAPAGAVPVSYDRVVSTVFTFIVALFTLLLAGIPTLDKFWYRTKLRFEAEKHERELEEKTERHRQEIEENRAVEIRRIETEHGGIDTLEELLKGCRRAIIFCGDFSWLLEVATFKERVIQLALGEKITLVSNLSQDRVRDALARDPEAREAIIKRVVSASDRDKIHLTYIWYDGKAQACCSLVTHDPGTPRAYRENIIIRSGRPDSLVLLDIVEQLADIERWNRELVKQQKKREA